jgi:hypothetical protein
MSFKSFLQDSEMLKKGIEVEKEHKDLYAFYTNFLKKYDLKNPLTLDQFAGRIATDHITEASKWKDKDYYGNLEKMEDKMKNA